MRDTETSVNSGSGYLRATTMVHITDIWGQKACRNVVIGKLYNVSMADAAHIVHNAREANPSQSISANFTISL